MDNVHYQEITKPHTKHDEIYNRLSRLDNKIERVEQRINDAQGFKQDISGLQKDLIKANELRDQAELAWDTGQYTEADKFISEAHAVLDQITLPLVPPPLISWELIGGIIAGVIIISLVFWLVAKRRGESYHE